MVVYPPIAKRFCYFDDEFLRKKRRKYDLDCFLTTWFSWIMNFIIKLNNAFTSRLLWRFWWHWIQIWSPISGCENTALCLSQCFPIFFWLAPPFLTNNFYRPPTMPNTHINTMFRSVYLGCLKMIKARMSAKMHFTIKLNLVN